MFYKEINTTQTSIGNLPKDWKVVLLRDIAQVKGGKRLPKGEKLVDYKTGFPYIRVVDFKNGKVDVSSVKYLLPETYKKIKNYTISSDDVYISIAGTVGLAGLIPPELDGANLTENAAKLCGLREVRKEFLSYLLNSRFLRKQIIRLMGKGTQPKLALFRIGSLKLPLPPLQEQERIAQVLGVVDSAIELVDKVIWKTERLKKGLMQTLLTRGIGHKEYKQTPIGTIPKEWEVVNLEEVIEVVSGQYFKFSEFVNDGVRCLKIDNVGYGEVVWKTATFLPTDYLRKFPKLVLKEGDIVMALNRPIIDNKVKVGMLQKGDSPSILYQRVGKIVIKDATKLNRRFLFFMLRGEHFKQQLGRSLIGTDQPYVRTPVLLRIKIPLPPVSEQQRIAEILSYADRKLGLERLEKDRLERTKRGLMDLLLTGKIRVKVD